VRLRLACIVLIALGTIAGCGDDPTAPLRNVDSTSSRIQGHEHRATIAAALIDDPPPMGAQLETTAAEYTAGGIPEHTHNFMVFPTDLAVLQQPGGRVEVETLESEGHRHIFVFSR
jgi:hypothetical protein